MRVRNRHVPRCRARQRLEVAELQDRYVGWFSFDRYLRAQAGGSGSGHRTGVGFQAQRSLRARAPTRSRRWCCVRKPALRAASSIAIGHRIFHRRCRGQIFDPPAVRAHEMVMMPGEILGQLVARQSVARHHAVHDAGLFEHHEVAVRRALRQAVARGEHLGNRERAGRGGEDVDDLALASGVSRCDCVRRATAPLHRAEGGGRGHRREVYGLGSHRNGRPIGSAGSSPRAPR